MELLAQHRAEVESRPRRPHIGARRRLLHLPGTVLYGRLEAQRNFLFLAIETKHLGRNNLPHVNKLSRVFNPFGRELGHVHHSFHAFLYLDESTEVGDVGHLALHRAPHRVAVVHVVPRIFGHLLQAEGQAFVGHIDRQHHDFHRRALVHYLRRMADPLGPVHIRHVYEPIDAVGNVHKETEVGHAGNSTGQLGPHRVIDRQLLPGVGSSLLHAQRHPAVGLVDAENYDVNFIVDRHHLRRMRHPRGPGHFGNVDQALDAFFDFHEGTVVDNAHDLASQPAAGKQAICDRVPGIFQQLFHPKRNATRLGIKFENDDLYYVARLYPLRRRSDTAVRHVGDVEQAVEPTNVNKRTVVGHVLYDALEYDPLVENGDGLVHLEVPFFLEKHLARNDHVAARAIELEYGVFLGLAHVTVQATRRTNLDVRAWKKSGNAKVYRQATLNLADHGTLNRGLAVEGFLYVLPDDGFFCASERKDQPSPGAAR